MDTSVLEGKEILVVEDEPSNYDLIRVFLKRYKPNLSWVMDGKDAVDACKTTDYNVILMDIQLPYMNGLEATRLIKEIDVQIPVIAQTAYAMSQDRQKALSAGCDDYIAKPMKRKDLVELIIKHIR
ncbi:MAG TPA: response regulator [Bacteroidales bacterium]|nr:response regulator [Bacteroidales bacterium]